MGPASPTRHKSYNMDFWKSEQSTVLIFQEGSTIERCDMEEPWALVRKDNIPYLLVVLKGQQGTQVPQDVSLASGKLASPGLKLIASEAAAWPGLCG